MNSEAEQQQPSSPASFWSELKRRHVVRVASVYAVVAWLVIQVAGTTFEGFGIPMWAFRFVVIMLVLGFPISLIIAWAFELTPDGFTTTGAALQANIGVPESAAHNKKRAWVAIVFAVAVPTLIFGTMALVFYLRLAGDDVRIDDSVAAKAANSIAVLPLINLSASADNAFFAGGVHEDILTNLAHIEGLRVISRTSAMRYIDSDLSLRDIGLALGAKYIVEGSVRRVDNHVRVSVQLLDAAEDVHLWASNYDRELVDVFATQSAVARAITDSLHLEIRPETVGTLEDMPTRSVKAYDLYMKAQSIDRSEPESESSLARQRELLEAAVEEDAEFVEAWGFLNEIYDHIIRNINLYGWFLPEGTDGDTVANELGEKSRRALNKAVALDPENIETLLARASDSVAEANPEFRLERKKVIDYVIEQYPRNAMAWYVLGWWYSMAGDNDAAKPAFMKALELDPLHARIVSGSLVYFRLMAADQEMTALLFERLAQIAPEMGKDRRLGKVSVGQKLNQLQVEFFNTADESLIERMADLLETRAGDYEYEIYALDARASLWEFQNDLERLAQLEFNPLLQDQGAVAGIPEERLLAYLFLHGRLLRQYVDFGRMDKAKATAEHIIDTAALVPSKPQFDQSISLFLTAAYATLDEDDKAWEIVETMLDQRSPGFDAYGLKGFLALSALDADRAVELVLAEASQKSFATGLGAIAALHILFRKIIVHPDMQAHYVKEGKWIDYLAKRVPEYEKYRTGN